LIAHKGKELNMYTYYQTIGRKVIRADNEWAKV